MQKVLLQLILAGLIVVAKPSFDGDNDELIETIANQEDDESKAKLNEEDPVRSMQSIFTSFIHFLVNTSVGNVRPDEHPDRKYIRPGEKLIRKLLVVRQAVIDTFGPIIEIGKLIVQDHNEMMRRLITAVRRQNIFQAKHIVGEYFIALNRRFVLFVIHANRLGLFRGIGKNRREDTMHLHRVKRELEDQAIKAHQTIRFILENFNEYRISDGLLDEPFVTLGVETVQVFIKASKKGIEYGKSTMYYYIDMITDIVRLALVEKQREAAIQRAGAGVLAGIRRDAKTIVAIQRWFVQRKCFPNEHEDEPKRGLKTDKKTKAKA